MKELKEVLIYYSCQTEREPLEDEVVKEVLKEIKEIQGFVITKMKKETYNRRKWNIDEVLLHVTMEESESIINFSHDEIALGLEEAMRGSYIQDGTTRIADVESNTCRVKYIEKHKKLESILSSFFRSERKMMVCAD